MIHTTITIVLYLIVGALASYNHHLSTRKRNLWIIPFWGLFYLVAIGALLFANKKQKDY